MLPCKVLKIACTALSELWVWQLRQRNSGPSSRELAAQASTLKSRASVRRIRRMPLLHDEIGVVTGRAQAEWQRHPVGSAGQVSAVQGEPEGIALPGPKAQQGRGLVCEPLRQRDTPPAIAEPGVYLERGILGPAYLVQHGGCARLPCAQVHLPEYGIGARAQHVVEGLLALDNGRLPQLLPLGARGQQVLARRLATVFGHAAHVVVAGGEAAAAPETVVGIRPPHHRHAAVICLAPPAQIEEQTFAVQVETGFNGARGNCALGGERRPHALLFAAVAELTVGALAQGL